MSEAQEFNPFDTSSYATNETVATELPENAVETTELETTNETTNEQQTGTEASQESSSQESYETESQEATEANVGSEAEEFSFEWPNQTAKDIYEKLVSGNISELADMIYEQKVLSNLDSMDDSDVIKLKMAYDYPDLTPDEIEEEYISKFNVEDDIDETMMSDEEIASKRKQIEKQRKSIARDLKKDSRDAREQLSSLKQDISFPDILGQMQNVATPNTEEIVNQFLQGQEAQQNQAYQQARQDYLSSVEDGLKSFEGFNVNYKDEDVQFDGKYNLTQDEKVSLTNTLKDFDLEEFYGNRYFKDGRYDTKQLAEDVYFLQNKDKIVNSMVTQAVSRAKSDLLKAMKNVDYNDTPRVTAPSGTDEYTSMVSKLYSL